MKIPNLETIDYSKCTITRIRRGTNAKARFVYANLVDENNELVISATLDYIVDALKERLPKTQ